jgi:hypothetical protein
LLKAFDFSLTKVRDQKQLAESVLRLSSHYIESPEKKSPWDQSWCQAAYLSYFLPMGILRAQKVVNEAAKLGFFEGVSSAVDFGSGLGTGSFVLSELKLPVHSVEISDVAIGLHKKIEGEVGVSAKRSWSKTLDGTKDRDFLISINALTEFPEIPRWVTDFQNILIVEPSTFKDSRRLMEFRTKLIERGFYIWAPCVHQRPCPLLVHSKKDWCHDKVKVELPEKIQNFVDKLPIQAKNLGFSYLLASKREPPNLSGHARVVGDLLIEKGKNRQLFCDNEERKFLAWLKRDHKRSQDVPRGARIEITDAGEMVSNELRIPSGKEIKIW